MTLDEIISQRIPPAMLEKVVFDQQVIELGVQGELFKTSGLTQRQLAQKIVERYGKWASKLAFGLYDKVVDNDWETAALLSSHAAAGTGELIDHRQASLVGRYPTLPIDELSEFTRSVKRQVCLIVSRHGNGKVHRGTGFLVGPDLVLTCRHVVDKTNLQLPANLADNGRRVEVYFDFFHGSPVEDFDFEQTDVKRASLHPNWHVASSESADPDGLEGTLNEKERERIAAALDFVVLRLEEKVGLQPVDAGGGRRRGWVTVSFDRVPPQLAPDAWIIIPQHPGGFPQRIDLGRFRQTDETTTRIRYSTNAAQGTSGAPCFDHRFRLVGMHNAYVGLPSNPTANQAIRMDHIARQTSALLDVGDVPDAYVLRWSISRPAEAVRVILGRTILLEWLRDSATASPSALAQRVYAARAEGPHAGCTFSLDVLNAETRDSKAPRAVYSDGGQLLPSSVEDFLLSLLREFGINAARVQSENPMPSRPTGQSGSEANRVGEVDKLERWLSDELPNWLGDVVLHYTERSVDLRENARKLVALMKEAGRTPDPELAEEAEAHGRRIQTVRSWDYAYIAIDCLRVGSYNGTGGRNDLSGELRNLIAALVRGKPESAMHPGLKRLRWMFLGYLPDFIAVADTGGNGATFEDLNPANVSAREVSDLFLRMAAASLKMQEVGPLTTTLARAILRPLQSQPSEEPWMLRLQRAAAESAMDLLKEATTRL